MAVQVMIEELHPYTQSGHASLCKQCAILAGQSLTEGQHRPKAGKIKKTHEVGLFFSGPHFIMVVLHQEVG